MVPNMSRITPLVHPMVGLLAFSASFGGLSYYTHASEIGLPLAQTQTVPHAQIMNFSGPHSSTGDLLGDSLEIEFLPPHTDEDGDASDRPRGGGSRCGDPDDITCLDLSLTALVPSREHIIQTEQGDTDILFSVWGQTLSAHPTLWFYVPYGAESVHRAELELRTLSGDLVHYDTDVSLGDTPGIWGYTIPSTVSFDVDETYRWSLLVKIYPYAPATDELVSGRIQRVALPPQTQHQLTQSSAIEQAYILGQSGIWYDLLTTMVTAYPQNSSVWQTAWHDVLSDVGLADIANASLDNASTVSMGER